MTKPVVTHAHREAATVAYEAEYIDAARQEAFDEKRGCTELRYPADCIREAFENGFAAGVQWEQRGQERAGGDWAPLMKPDGTLAVDGGETYLFAIEVSAYDGPCHWEYFADSITWDAETDPEWRDGGHGWGMSDEIWFRPLPSPPRASETGADR